MNDKHNEIFETKETEEIVKRNPLNIILIILIIVFAVLLVLQIKSMNNAENILPSDDDIPIVTSPEKVELSPTLFDVNAVYLSFDDVVFNLKTEAILNYYKGLTDDISNFTPVIDKILIPSESIFELNYVNIKDLSEKELSARICFYDSVNGDKSYCTVIHDGKILGTYLIPSEYYGNLYNIIYSSNSLTKHTKETILGQLPALADGAKDVSVLLDETYSLVKGDTLISMFEGRIKRREPNSIIYSINDEKLFICCYMNFRYYIYLTEMDGTVIQEGVYNHYGLLTDGYITFYNDEQPTATENLMITESSAVLRVG